MIGPVITVVSEKIKETQLSGEEWADAEAALGLYHDNSVIDLINHD